MKKFIIWAIVMTSILGIGMYFLVSDTDDKNKKNSNTSNKVVNDSNSNINIENDNQKSNDLSKTITPISQIKFDNKNDIVKIKGVISKIGKSKENDIFLTVEDESGSILVPIFKDKDIEKDSLAVGVEVEVIGKIDIYKDNLEVIPEYKSDVKIINKDTTNQNESQNENKDEKVIDKADDSDKKYSSELIDESKINETVLVEGDVLSKYNHDDGHVFIYIKTNGNEKLNIPIFSSVNYDSSNLNVGSNVSISGKVKLYKGQIQVVPQNNYDIKIN